MLKASVLVFVIVAAWSSHQSESSSAFNRSLCQVPMQQVRGTVVKGSPSLPHEWPWLVSLVYKNEEKFFCGGSLITERIVLTAAHCLQYKNVPEPIDPSDVKVYFAKWNLSDATEPNAVEATPEELIIHHDWNVSDTRWDADIAIVKLANDVTFSSSIQPVCLWTSQMQPRKTDDGGTVVGWGRTENQRHSNIPRAAKLNVLPFHICYENDDLTDAFSSRGLCVGGQGSGPCDGDSGGGFFTFELGKWFLRGITSVSGLNAFKECNVNAPAVFTNVEKFTSWIDQVLDGNEQMKCKFELHGDDYKCRLQNSFPRRDTKIFQVSGSHVEGRTNGDVRKFESTDDSKLKFLPIHLGRFFPNLDSYEVKRSAVVEISRRNFADLPKLKELWIVGSRLNVIPVDAFYDLANLEFLVLWGNQIEAIDSSTFIRNTKLREINLSTSKINSLDSTSFRNNLKLHGIDLSNNLLTSIGRDLLAPLQKLTYVDFNNNTCIDKRWGNFKTILPPSEKKEFKETFASQCQ